MKTMRNLIQLCLLGAVLLALPAVAQAQFTFTTNDDNTITITGYTGNPATINIPSSTNGYPVTSIKNNAFYNKSSLTAVTIPSSITTIGYDAFFNCAALTNIIIPDSVTDLQAASFYGCGSLVNAIIGDGVTSINGYTFFYCSSLTKVLIGKNVIDIEPGAFNECFSLTGLYFTGNAPTNVATYAFLDDSSAVVYFLPNTTGWDQFAQMTGLPTSPWLPEVHATESGFAQETNQFGFNINWASGQTVVVEASTNLPTPVWQPLQSITLTNGSACFSDPQWTNYPSRFYRLRSP